MSELQPRATEEYGKFPLWFLRLFMLITAMGVLYVGFRIYKSYDSSDWPFVSGMIERSWGTVSPDTPHVRYTYTVGGKIYQGDKVAFRSVGGVYEKRRVLSRYPSGKKVGVYFNPKNHGDSVLERGYKKGSGIWIIVPLVMFLLAMFLHRHVQAVRAKTMEEEVHSQK